jgi:raffinose/stachyose/melibiose transport system permease protein
MRRKPGNYRRHVRFLPVYLVLFIFTLVAVVPFIWAMLNSLRTNNEILGTGFALPLVPQWGNYTTAWSKGHLDVYYMNSIFIAVPEILLVLTVSALAGYAFAKMRFAGSSFMFYLFLLGLTVPFQAIMIPLYYSLMGLRLLDNLIGVILPACALSLSFGIFFMRAFFRQLPDELIDSGRMDGCGDFRIFRRIMLPLAKPAVVTLTILTFLSSWNNFLLPLIVLHSDAKRTIPLGIVNFRDNYSIDYGLVFAAVMISVVPVIIMYVIFQREFINGVAGGALKD